MSEKSISGQLRLLALLLWFFVAAGLAALLDLVPAVESEGVQLMIVLSTFAAAMAAAVSLSWLVRFLASYAALRQLRHLINVAESPSEIYETMLFSYVMRLKIEEQITSEELDPVMQGLASLAFKDLAQRDVTLDADRILSVRLECAEQSSRPNLGKLGRQGETRFLSDWKTRGLSCPA